VVITILDLGSIPTFIKKLSLKELPGLVHPIKSIGSGYYNTIKD
jgi:hypothetical protein